MREQITLRDVMFLCHPKPKNKQQAEVFRKLANNELNPPDTWEVSLSAKNGESKKDKWERLLQEQRLGAMALLRNLRNMKQAQLDDVLVVRALEQMKPARVLPFRFIAAARYAPRWEEYLEAGMLKCLQEQEKFPGRTVLLIDVSGSMDWKISARSEMTRMDAACGLAILAREICEQVEIFSFSNSVVQVPTRHGFALRDALVNSQPHGATYLGRAVRAVEKQVRKYDRLIVLTDEQSHDRVPDPSLNPLKY